MSVTLTPRERRVLHALAFLAGEDGTVTVSQRDLATALGWSRHSGLRRDIRSLERHGMVLVAHNGGTATERRSNTFTVTSLGHEVADAEQEKETA